MGGAAAHLESRTAVIELAGLLDKLRPLGRKRLFDEESCILQSRLESLSEFADLFAALERLGYYEGEDHE